MTAPTPNPGRMLGHFRLIEEIGAGGMGIVYRARDTRLERDVAVKVLNLKTLSSDSARKRFRHEALILSRLNHPNIESVYDFHSEQGIDYLVMEYVPGVSLNERLEKGPLPERELLEVGIQLARGLTAAHAQRIIHRDLKPGNLKLTPDNVLKILDFGLAQLCTLPEDETVSETVAVQSPAAGTPAYLSPEQLDGKEPDTRSDIYSAGAVLYELATRSRPFPHKGQLLADAILHSLPPAPRLKNKDISPDMEAVILKCLEKDPKMRYQSANELLEDLKELARGSGPHRLVAVQPSSSWPSKRWLFVGLALMVLLLAAVALRSKVVGWLGRKEPSLRQQQKIMAVLPIDAVGQDPATSALGLGLTETVTAKLAQASDSDAIQVVSPRDLRDQGVKTAEDARREFGTDFVLESSLQRSGQTIRINCYLVDSKTHRQLAAKTIEAQAGDPFGLQDRVVSAALDMLPSQIKPEERLRLNVTQDTQPPVYEAYIRGRGYLQEYEKPENIDSAIAEFETATRIDPNYAPAYAGLGEAYWIGYQQLNQAKEWLTRAAANCRKALVLDPRLAAGHTCLGNISFATGEYEEAVRQYKYALDLDPNSDYALGQLADAYQKIGKPAAAEAAYRQAISLRPNYWGLYSGLGVFYGGEARYTEAGDMFKKVTELAPDNYRGYSNLGGIYVYQGRYSDAIDVLKRSIELRPNRDAYANLGAAYFWLHQFANAVKVCQQALELDNRDPLSWGNLADALYWSPGRRAEALTAYQKAVSLARAKLEVNPRDAVATAYVAEYSAMLDHKEPAIANAQRALALAPEDPEVMFRVALVYNHFGDKRDALSWLQKSAKAGFSPANIRDTPDFNGLRDSPEFRALVADLDK
jgi:eukaryotic-like serine/threonine-protein kinase